METERQNDLPPGLGAPARRALVGAGYERLEQLAGADRADLLKLHGFGPRAIRVLDEALAQRGLGLGGGDDRERRSEPT
jgi:hypothetical protein